MLRACAGGGPDLAVARWGIAYSVGPNYNKAWEAFDPVDLVESLTRARAELDRAASGRASEVERDLIDALAARFPTADPTDTDALDAGGVDYADAMARLAERHPGDVDVQALAADALVNVTAWALWDGRTGEPAPGSRVVEAKRILDAALATPPVACILACCTSTCTPWRCRLIPRRFCRRPTCSAASSRTPVTSSTCRVTSTCCAVTTAAR